MFVSPSAPRYSRSAGVSVGSLAAGLMLVSAAHADLKMVQKTAANGTITTTTSYFKNGKFRTDSRQSIVIMVGEKLLTLSPTRKTYTETTMNRAGGGMAQMMDFKTTSVIKPGGKTKTILGKPAKNYVYTLTMQMVPSKEALQQMKASGRPLPAQFPSIIIEGEQWVSEAVKMPTGAVANSMRAIAEMPGMKEIIAKFAAIKGAPLETRQTMTFKNMPAAAAEAAKPQTITTTTTEISEAPLSDSLFQVPAGYKKMAAPTMPGAPGGGMAPRPKPM
jgi:Tfp pilus assembly major pilin PilA